MCWLQEKLELTISKVRIGCEVGNWVPTDAPGRNAADEIVRLHFSFSWIEDCTKREQTKEERAMSLAEEMALTHGVATCRMSRGLWS